MKRMDNESFMGFAKRVTDAFQDGLITAEEWGEAILGENVYGSENTRRCAKFMVEFLEKFESENQDVAIDKISELEKVRAEIIKERKKIQTLNSEAQEYYRERARSELLVEQLQDAVSNLEPFQVKRIVHTKPAEKVAILTIADAHYDSNFEINGLFGEKVNVYNKQSFQNRMWSLLAKIEADDFDFEKIKVISMGDCVEGLIRMSSLKKLRQPVVESVIEFAEFMATWLVELHNRLEIPVEFAVVPGNHSICRFLSQKPEFQDENLEYIIHAFIKLRLENQDWIKIEPYNDVYFTTIFNENLIFAHGEAKDLETLMNYFENLYDITIDACFGAHYHSESSKAVGVGNIGSKRIIRVPSMVGCDPYANSIMKNSRAGAYFSIFSDDGEDLNKIYYLN